MKDWVLPPRDKSWVALTVWVKNIQRCHCEIDKEEEDMIKMRRDASMCNVWLQASVDTNAPICHKFSHRYIIIWNYIKKTRKIYIKVHSFEAIHELHSSYLSFLALSWRTTTFAPNGSVSISSEATASTTPSLTSRAQSASASPGAWSTGD